MPIPVGLAEARERLWTPEAPKVPEGGLWTPVSQSRSPRKARSEPSHPDGHRADLPRRAFVRHLLAPAQRADHLPRHPGRRPDRQPDHRPAPAPGERGPRQGDLDLHQLAGRVGVRGSGDLRHDAVHQAGRADDLRRHRDEHGRAAAGGWRAGQADVAAQLQDPDPPGLGRVLRSGDGHRDPRQGDPLPPRASSTRSSPTTPARRSRRSPRTPSATTS